MAMSYVSSVLGKDETVYYEAEVSLLPFLPKLIIGGALILMGLVVLIASIAVGGMRIFDIALILIGILVFVPPFIAKKTTELVITNRRIIAKFGLIKRHTIEINLSKIESIRVSQGVLGRMLNYGDLEIVGTGGTREPIPKISHPLMFRRKFDEILNS